MIFRFLVVRRFLLILRLRLGSSERLALLINLRIGHVWCTLIIGLFLLWLLFLRLLFLGFLLLRLFLFGFLFLRLFLLGFLFLRFLFFWLLFFWFFILRLLFWLLFLRFLGSLFLLLHDAVLVDLGVSDIG